MRETELKPARFWPRLCAWLLDRLLLGAVLFLPRLGILIRSVGSSALERAVLFRFSWGDILCWLLVTAYFTALTAVSGATLGKKAMGLRVVTKTGEKPSFIMVLCRESFARYLSGILLIGYLLFLADPQGGTLHDRICDTMVVDADALPEKPKPVSLRALNPVKDPVADWYEPYRK